MSHPNRQVTRSQRALQRALLELIDEKPYSKISISEIAERADLARSTFYSHFDDKDDLLSSFLDEALDPFVQHLVSRGTVPTEPSQSEISLLISVCDLWAERKDALLKIKGCGQELLILNKLREYIATVHHKVIARRYPRFKNSTGDFMIEYVSVVYFGILMQWLENDLEPPAATVGALLYELTGPPIVIRVMTDFGATLSGVD